MGQEILIFSIFNIHLRYAGVIIFLNVSSKNQPNHKIMKALSIVAFCLMLISGSITGLIHKTPLLEKYTEAPAKDGVFIHISEGYDHPHRVLMPLKMAAIMSENKDVIVYMDIDAVNLLVKGAKDLEFEGFDSFQAYIKQLVNSNVGIYACPTCLKIAGFEANDLVDGVKIAEKEKFFNFTAGRIISLDY